MTSDQAGSLRGRREPSAAGQREIEWQFDADDLGPVEGWLEGYSSGASGLLIRPEPAVGITDSYHDTEDWRLYRAGYALRIRGEDDTFEATMKSLSSAQDGPRNRLEISEPLEDGEVSTLGEASGPVGGRTRRIAGAHELRRLFNIRTDRKRFALWTRVPGDDYQDGVRVGEVSLDASEISAGGEPVPLRRVEVEVVVGTEPGPGLYGFVEEMQDALDLTPAVLSKYETGLYTSGSDPEGDTGFGPTHVDPSMRMGEVAFAVLRRQFARMRSHEAGARLGEDPEELHDMRVPTRRMRAALKTFEDVLPESARPLRQELRWVAQALGEVRDLDVQIGRLEGWRRGASRERSGALDKIIRITEKRRDEARGNMISTLDSERYERLESSFARMLRRGPEGEPSQTDGHDPASEPVTSAAPALISRRYRKWKRSARSLDEASSPEVFHDVRKKGKRLRYTLECFSEVYGKPVRRLVKPLKVLQRDLGDHQDAVVLAADLEELGTTTGGIRVQRGVAFAMGVYAERCNRAAQDLRRAVPGSEPLRALKRGKKWKAFEKALQDENGVHVPGESVR